MPANYEIELYNAISEASTGEIVKKTIDGMLSAGCKFKHYKLIDHTTSSPPEIYSKMSAAAEYAEKYIDAQIAFHKKDKIMDLIRFDRSKIHMTLPTKFLTLVFHCDFKFDPEALDKLKDDDFFTNQDDLMQIHVCFDSSHSFFQKWVYVRLTAPEEYVLMFGNEVTHRHNLNLLLQTFESLCNSLSPHYGFMQCELGPYAPSYEAISKGELKVENDFICIGTQLLKKIGKKKIEESRYFKMKLNNGGIILSGLNQNKAT